jgi:hypothetical protein
MNLVALSAIPDDAIRMTHKGRATRPGDAAATARMTPAPGAGRLELAGILVMRPRRAALSAGHRQWKNHFR